MSWDVLPATRSPKVNDRSPITMLGDGNAGVRHSNSTSVFCEIQKLLKLWRHDPDRLALALAIWSLAGYPGRNAVDDVSGGDLELGIKSIPRDDAWRLCEEALHRRNKNRLRQRAEGALIVLEEIAQMSEAMRLHDLQQDVAIIECRVLTSEERLAKLLEK